MSNPKSIITNKILKNISLFLRQNYDCYISVSAYYQNKLCLCSHILKRFIIFTPSSNKTHMIYTKSYHEKDLIEISLLDLGELIGSKNEIEQIYVNGI